MTNGGHRALVHVVTEHLTCSIQDEAVELLGSNATIYVFRGLQPPSDNSHYIHMMLRSNPV